MHEARELWQSSVSRAHSSISKRKNTTEIRNLSVRARRHIFSFPLFFFFKKKKKKKKHRLTLTLIGVQMRPYVIITHIWFRFCRLMYKTLSLQPSVVDYKKIYTLRPIFWLESRLITAKKKKKTKKQRSTVVKLLVAEYAVKVH